MLDALLRVDRGIDPCGGGGSSRGGILLVCGTGRALAACGHGTAVALALVLVLSLRLSSSWGAGPPVEAALPRPRLCLCLSLVEARALPWFVAHLSGVVVGFTMQSERVWRLGVDWRGSSVQRRRIAKSCSPRLHPQQPTPDSRTISGPSKSLGELRLTLFLHSSACNQSIHSFIHTAEATMAAKRASRAAFTTSPSSSPQCHARSSTAAQRAYHRIRTPQYQHQQQLRAESSSSTSAIAYKALHRRISPLPAASTSISAVSPAAAVSSILYETPLPDKAPPKRHVLNCLVQNEPGVLSRISGILAARGFNIDSLVVCSTEVPDLSRMTIVIQGQDGVVEQARRQLEDLVPVWAVLDYTAAPLVQRELLLAKISIMGPEYFEELLAHHREMSHYSPSEDMAASQQQQLTEQEMDMTPDQLADARERGGEITMAEDFHPSNLAPSEALRLKHQHLETITYLTHQFGGKVLDISTNNCIVELSAKPTRIDSFMKLIGPFGILESARTGMSYLVTPSDCCRSGLRPGSLL